MAKKKADTIRVIKKDPGKAPVEVQIPNTLEDLQRAVGGYLEAVTYTRSCVILCNEEGRLMGMPYNTVLFGHKFVGPILLVGTKGDEFADCPITVEGACFLLGVK